jgi:NADH-quinone oxidoreductase subunit C
VIIILSGSDIAARLSTGLKDAVAEINREDIVVDGRRLTEIASYLKDSPDLDFNYLSYITVADYPEYLELIYQLFSFHHSHSVIFKVRCRDKETPAVPTVTGIWKGAEYQEREIYDMAGVVFDGHPDMKRILTWEGFQGHPLRKDFKNDD